MLVDTRSVHTTGIAGSKVTKVWKQAKRTCYQRASRWIGGIGVGAEKELSGWRRLQRVDAEE